MIKLILRLFPIAVFIVLGAAYVHRAELKAEVMQLQAQHQPAVTTSFPLLDTNGFSETQLRLLAQLKLEYDKKPLSFDPTVLKYTDGVKEPWCADFVSWNMRELGQPLVNPNGGGWRIPGVYTLREYYQSAGRWKPAGDYVPTFGDVAIYAKTPAKSHTNFVLKVDTKTRTMVTIGGNEQGRLRLSARSYSPPIGDIAGFGSLQN